LDAGAAPSPAQTQVSFPKSYLPKRAAVIGAARSGIGAAQFLKRKGVSVFVSDTCSQEKLDKLLEVSGLADLSREAGKHTDAVLANDVIVLSPGVASDLPVLKKAKSRGIPVWSEIELAYRFTDAQFLAITGSSGKSTTTSLLGAVLEAAGRQHAVAGNIGIPLINVVETLPAGAFVAAEISSFQLENIDLFPAQGRGGAQPHEEPSRPLRKRRGLLQTLKRKSRAILLLIIALFLTAAMNALSNGQGK